MKRGFWADYKASYRGPYAWTSWLVLVEILLVTGMNVWFVIELFNAQTTREQILWGLGAVVGIIWVTALKMWAWSVIHRNAIEARLDEIEKGLALAREE